MRYRQVTAVPLYESKSYNTMFTTFLRVHPEMAKEVKAMMNRARLTLKREDRIVWFLRWYRISLEVASQVRDKTKQHGALVPSAMDYMRRSDITSTEMRHAQHLHPDRLLANLAHYVGLPAPSIQQRIWRWENWMTLLDELEAAERAWVAGDKEGSRVVAPKGGDQILIEFPNGLAWWLLDRHSCSDEARAMRHCGNSPSDHTTQGRKERIISLREKIHKGNQVFYKPYLTFILLPDGHLGEMKGFANQSPMNAHTKGMPSAFHDEIAALLKLPMIKGIHGGQWMTGQDFQLSQLPEAARQSVLWDRPDFAEAAITTYASLIKQVDVVIKAYEQLNATMNDDQHDEWWDSEFGPPGALEKLQLLVGRFRHLIGRLPVGIRGYEEMHRFIKVDDDFEEEELGPGENLEQLVEAGKALAGIRLRSDYLMMMRLSNLLMSGPTDDEARTEEFWESPSGPPEFMNRISTEWTPAAQRLLRTPNPPSPLRLAIRHIVDLILSDESPSEIYMEIQLAVEKFRRANNINPVA